MAVERAQLEALGYTFEVLEEPITEPKSPLDQYYRVVIRYRGDVLGTRSEIRSDRALERAYQFAYRHSRGDDPRSLMV